ncbi:MAG: BolA family transcriptional regulator [Rhodospirillaceae bacterium]|nr:MAG: BolA family transcriptional regulator [Rhodospirillaceae bacterium]
MRVQEQIEAKLKAAFSPEILEVENQSHLHAGHAGSPNSGESHFRVTLKADKLNALSRIERYRKVHFILKDELDGPVHALSLSFV